MKDTKHVRWDFHSVAWAMPQGWDFGAGAPRGSKIILFQTWSIGIYQIDGDDKQSRMQVKFYPMVKLVTLGVRSKGQI